MVGNYLKTASRNLKRNKLFSFITILGLSISMSVGLLLIAFITDLQSYDRYNENFNAIYRVTNVVTSADGTSEKFASSSIKAGRLIKEKVIGIDEVAIMRNGFGGDANIGNKILPLKGFWAQASILDIFTWPMIEGNVQTALVNPYTIVLTENTAKKLFGSNQVVGKSITVDSNIYQITGVIKDLPFFSHLKFEALASFATIEQWNKKDKNFDAWTNMSSNLIYLKKQKEASNLFINNQLDHIAKEENAHHTQSNIWLQLSPLSSLVVGEKLISMENLGPNISPRLLWLLFGLTLIVILSACFNYAILTLARSIRRHKEVGLRKTLGANRKQVILQFLMEAVLVSLISLGLSVILFFLLRPQIINLAPEMQYLVKLELAPVTLIIFILFALAVGLLAGFIPAWMFSKINAGRALRNSSSLKFIKQLSLRRALVLVQYTLTLIFITSTAIGYVQYKKILSFDLGFNTENILNIELGNAESEALINELKELPEIMAVSKSLIVTSIGNAWGGMVKYKNPLDSSLVMTNNIDENYLTLHEYDLLSGEGFISKPSTKESIREIIVNEQFLKRFNIANGQPDKAIGEEITFNSFQIHNQKMAIVGVIKDFHYGKMDNLIEPNAFMPWTPGDRTILNVKIKSMNLSETISRIESIYKVFDEVHPFEATFYDRAIEEAYSEYSMMLKIIGFLAFLAITIASMGLLGMVTLNTETKLKEIGIRKVLGANSIKIVYLLSKDFLVLLALSAIIALPVVYLFFERVILTRFPYHDPIKAPEVFVGLFLVLLIAFSMMGSQALKAAQTNPASVLRSE